MQRNETRSRSYHALSLAQNVILNDLTVFKIHQNI